MIIEQLQLRNFRNYQDTRISFFSENNLVIGGNGEGKSNILEAIFMLSSAKSFRGVTDKKIIHWGESGYEIEGFFSGERGERTVKLIFDGEKKHLFLDGLRENRLSSIIGAVFCVLYGFDDIYLVTGPPALRRGFLDLVLSTVDPVYFNALKELVSVVRQKNHYLQGCADIDLDLLYSWNEQLVEKSAYILLRRMDLLDFINTFIDEAFKDERRHSFPYRVVYKSTARCEQGLRTGNEIAEVFRAELSKHGERELLLRKSIYGPHRDDMAFSDGHVEMRYFGSLGEARLLSIVLKSAQVLFYRNMRRVDPILLIDDVFLELDHINISKITQLIGETNQKIITSTSREHVPEIFHDGRVFNIDKGIVSWEK